MATSIQWQLARAAAERYEQILVPAILGPAARALVEWTPLQSGQTVLDVGCGTGAAARFAATRVGEAGCVLCLDVNGGMLDVARALPPIPGAPIEYHDKSAHELPLDDDSVDAVVCAQTLQFLTDRPRAMSEMRRVLKPGGRLSLSVWSEIGENPYFKALVDAVSIHVGPDTAVGLLAAFSLSSAGELRALFDGAGFKETQLAARRLDLDLPPLPDFVPRHISATPMAPGYSAAPPEAQQAVVQEVSEQLASWQTEAGVRVPFQTRFAMGVK